MLFRSFPVTIAAGIVLSDYTNFWNSLKVKILESDGGLYTKRISELTSNSKNLNITLNKISADPYATILQFFTTKETANYIKVEIGQYDLKLLDQIRDVILHKKGNETPTQVYKKTVYLYLCILIYLKISSQTRKKINFIC